MNKKKTTVLMTAVLAVATVLTVGLTVLPGSVQEVQANPCTENSFALSSNSEANSGSEGGGDSEINAGEIDSEAGVEFDCDLTGVVIDEEVTTTEIADPFAVDEEVTEEEAEAAEDAEFE